VLPARSPGTPAWPTRNGSAWTIFTQTLIHDFDMLLWFNTGSRPVEVTPTQPYRRTSPFP
jgi:myo-inositol 2-dehydrogenase/D-chiro-inositol 1-dehydrogenase